MKCKYQAAATLTNTTFIAKNKSDLLWSPLLLIALSFCLPLHAIEVQYENRQPLSSGLSYIVDKTDQYHVSDLLDDTTHQWIPINREIPSFGFMATPIWLRIDINNTTDQHLNKILEVSYPLIDHLDVYLVQGKTIKSHHNTGDKRPFSERTVFHRDFIFPLEIPAGQSLLLIRAQTSGALQIPLMLWNRQSYWEQDQAVVIAQGMYFGIVFVMAVYNLFIFIILREATYLYYVLYSTFLGLFQASMHGLTFQYLWPTQVWWQERTIALFVCSAVMFGLLFTTSFLKLHSQHSLFDKMVKTAAGLSALVAISGMLMPFSWSVRLSTAMVFPTAILIMGAGIYSWLQGQRSARLFVIAWTSFLLGSLAMALNKFGWLPRTFLTESGVQIGSTIEIVLLSMALVDRINEERAEKNTAQNALISQKETARAELESHVAERTDALEKAMTELSTVNQRLEQLSTTDALTGVYNRRYFDEYLNREWQRGLRTQLPLSLILVDIDHFKQINDSYGHVVGDQCLQQVAQEIDRRICRTNDVVARYGGEEFAIILPHIHCIDAAQIAETLREIIVHHSIVVDEQQLSITASFGVASMVATRDTPVDRLITHADKALYVAKNNGRNCVKSFLETYE